MITENKLKTSNSERWISPKDELPVMDIEERFNGEFYLNRSIKLILDVEGTEIKFGTCTKCSSGKTKFRIEGCMGNWKVLGWMYAPKPTKEVKT